MSRLVATLLVLLGLLAVLPCVAMAFGSVYGGPEVGLTLAPWVTAFGDVNRTGTLLLQSAVSSLGSVLIASGGGCVLGFVAFRTDAPFRRTFIALTVVSACIPIYVSTSAWMALTSSGFWLNLDGWGPRSLGAAVLQGVAYLPHAMLLAGIAYRQSDTDLEEIARLNGTRWQVWRYSILPQSLWWLGAGAALVWLLSFTDITVTDLLRVRTFPEETFLQFQKTGDSASAAALNLPIVVLLLVAGAGLARSGRLHGQLDLSGVAPEPSPLRLGRVGRGIVGLGLVALMALYFVPFVALIKAAGSFKQFHSAYRSIAPEFYHSLWLAILSAVLGACLAYGMAWAMVHRPRWRWPLGLALALLLATPAPVVGVGLTLIYNHHGPLGAIYDSSAILLLTYISRTTAFGVLLLVPALRAVPETYREAARLEGATWLQTLRLVDLPLTWRPLLVSVFFLLILSLSELGASVLVVPPGTTTLAVRFATLIHSGVYPDVAGLCLMIIFGVVLPGLLLCWASWAWLKKRYV